MTENSDIIQCGVDDCAEGDKSDRGEQCRRKIQWNSRPYHNVKVAIVRPLSNSQDSHSSGSGTTDSPPTPVLSPFLQTQRRLRQRDISGQTRLEPFSFDERDTLQRVAYERRLEELRHVEERQRLLQVSEPMQ
ncbi:siaz-interacting nuclear protein isoform X2 [Hoplias malabaricus]|uniref:siaz-interacting nuclear protein isoform X2 n=1 Tax=Hoplias malabaricus TaxID=27720 RepID=UPI003462A2C2